VQEREDGLRAEQVAIDGPAASGKSTVARGLAQRLGGWYISSGNLYRALAWLALRRGLVPREAPESVLPLLASERIGFARAPDNSLAIYVNGERVDEAELRRHDVTNNVSSVAGLPQVREWLLERQRETRRLGLVVMEGRDIGTVVFPQARHKFFVTASAEERARRRLLQAGENPTGATLASVAAEIAERDRLDSSRAVAPLRPAPDAVTVDTTGMDVEAVVDHIEALIRRRQAHDTAAADT